MIVIGSEGGTVQKRRGTETHGGPTSEWFNRSTSRWRLNWQAQSFLWCVKFLGKKTKIEQLWWVRNYFLLSVRFSETISFTKKFHLFGELWFLWCLTIRLNWNFLDGDVLFGMQAYQVQLIDTDVVFSPLVVSPLLISSLIYIVHCQDLSSFSEESPLGKIRKFTLFPFVPKMGFPNFN